MKKWVSIVFSLHLLMASSPSFAVAKQYVSAREDAKGAKVIGPTGDAAARFTNKIPKNWTIEPAKKGIGTKYVNPKNPGDYIRYSAPNPDPRAPLGQKKPYFQRYKDGKVLTRDGEWVNPKTVDPVEYHIPQDKFDDFAHLLEF